MPLKKKIHLCFNLRGIPQKPLSFLLINYCFTLQCVISHLLELFILAEFNLL